MVPVLDKTLSQRGFSRPVNWRGRSGRYYALSPERLDDFMLRANELYLMMKSVDGKLDKRLAKDKKR